MDREEAMTHLEDLYEELVLNYSEWHIPEQWLLALEIAVEEMS